MTNPVQFWLTFSGGEEKLRLPVNPESVSVSTNHNYNDYTVAQLGEMTVIGDAGLSEFSFSSFFPAQYHPGYCEYEDIPDPHEAIQTLQRWRNERKPMRLIVTGTEVDTRVTLRDFEYDDVQFAQGGDIPFSMSFTEYRDVKFRTVSRSKPEPKREDERSQPQTYTVKSGDSLWKIAANKLGDGSRWREIYNKNKSVIGKNPDLIYPGQTYKLP